MENTPKMSNQDKTSQGTQQDALLNNEPLDNEQLNNEQLDSEKLSMLKHHTMVS